MFKNVLEWSKGHYNCGKGTSWENEIVMFMLYQTSIKTFETLLQDD